MAKEIIAPFEILNSNPLIILTIGIDSLEKILSLNLPKNKKFYSLVRIHYTLENDNLIEFKEIYYKVLNINPNNEIIILCNTVKEKDILNELGIKCIFCNNNCFVSEEKFKILENIRKDFDAIYNARMSPFKRHYLAKDIKSLALIYGDFIFDKDYFNKTKKLLPQAKWLNYINGNYKDFDSDEIANLLNRSRIGLCLSDVEGAMYASVEYMLCGLPVVSTKSIGGRDVFFDDKYVKIVDDNPEAVAKGVIEMIDRDIDPYYIRDKTIKKMKEERERN